MFVLVKHEPYADHRSLFCSDERGRLEIKAIRLNELVAERNGLIWTEPNFHVREHELNNQIMKLSKNWSPIAHQTDYRVEPIEKI
jgi:hypothetical protein